MRTKLLIAGAVLALSLPANAKEIPGLKTGTPAVKSISAMTFCPFGCLFIGDSASGAIHAVNTNDDKPSGTGEVSIDKLDDKIGGLLGVPGKSVIINDVKVNPASGNVYVAASRANAPAPVVVRITRDGKIEAFDLKDVPTATVTLPAASGGQSITSLAFVDGKVVVAGLATEGFDSTLRVIPFPFEKADQPTGVEIFHGAHGKLETKSPVRTFVPYKANGTDYLVAAYTCTPLVRLPLSELKPGAKVKGTTIAELGNRNRPLDMVVYTKDGKDYVLMANSAHGVIKLPAGEISSASAITEKPKSFTAGIKYDKIAELKDVKHLDKLDAGRVLLLIQPEGGNASLKTVPLP